MTEAVLNNQVMIYGSLIIKSIGKDVVHVFVFKKQKDFDYYRKVDNMVSSRMMYSCSPVEFFNSRFNCKVLNADKMIVAALLCMETKEVILKSYTTDRVLELSKKYADIPIQLMSSNLGNLGCANCSKVTDKLSSCSGCRAIKYCSKECQKEHWKAVHKKECNKKIKIENRNI